MYQGIPVVSTSIGIEGIPEAEKYAGVADEADTFAARVLELYEDQDMLAGISAKFRDNPKILFSTGCMGKNRR